MLVTETPVFVKDGLVLEYDRIEDYITDYRYRLADLRVQRLSHFKRVNDEELLFQLYKEKYLLFMLEGKSKKMKTDEEIDTFLTDLTKEHPSVRRRLDAILLRSLSDDELIRTREKIKELRKEIAQQEKDLADAIKVLASMEDTSLKRATQNRSNSITDLFVDEDEDIVVDGIEVFSQVTDHEEEE